MAVELKKKEDKTMKKSAAESIDDALRALRGIDNSDISTSVWAQISEAKENLKNARNEYMRADYTPES